MKRSMKIMHWTPRILCILAILFVSLFAFDSFDPKYTFWNQVQAFLMHMIPSFVLIIILIIAWRWELIGGSILIILALGFSPSIYIHNYHMNHSVWMSLLIILSITFPFMITGALFVISYFLKKKNPEITPTGSGHD